MPQAQQADPSVNVSDVKPNFKERAFGALGGIIAGGAGLKDNPLDAAIEKQHQKRLDEARMHRLNAATYAGILSTGIDPTTGDKLTPEARQKYQNWFDAAWAAYEKAAGVSKETKGALAKAKAVVGHLIGKGGDAGGQEQAQTDSTGSRLAPPPVPSSTTEAGEARAPAPAAGAPRLAPPPAPTYGPQEQMAAPALRQQATDVNKATAERTQKAKDIEQREEVAKRLGLRPGTLAYQEYVATEKFPPVARLQKAFYINPNDPTRTPRSGSYDPSSGQYLDQNGDPVEGALPATASMGAPKTIHYLSPDGRPLFGFQVGMKLYDQEGNELPPGTVYYTRGLTPTETLRQVITIDANGNPQINTLETIRRPLVGGQPVGGGAGIGAKAPQGRAPGGAPSTPAGGKDVTGRTLGMTPGMYNQQIQRVTPVREAAVQLLGTPEHPEIKSLKDYAQLADSAESRERLGTALRLTFDYLNEKESQSGSFLGLLQAYGGIPSALAEAKASVAQDVIGALDKDETDAYDATMTAFGTIVGLRALTKASAAQASVRTIERELPLIGVNTKSSRQFYDQLSRVALEVSTGARTISDAIMPREEKDYYKRQVEVLMRLKQGRLPAPPKPGAGQLSPEARKYLESQGVAVP